MKKELELKKLNKAVLVLKSINHKVRQDIVKLIDSKKEINVSDIYKRLKLEQSVASQHLAKLRAAKVLNTVRQGKFIKYSVNHDRISQIKTLVEEILK